MEIKKVAIIGVGSVGSYFIYGLKDLLHENLFVIASGERKKRLEDGIVINNQRVDLNVKEPEELEDIDLLLISVKYNALRDVLDDVKKVVSKNTIVVSLLNGVDSEEIISEVVCKDQIVNALMKISSERVGNSIRFSEKGTPGIFFGDRDKKENENVKALEELFKKSKIHYNLVDDILKEQWNKFALNVSTNLPQAVLGVGFNAYRNSKYVIEIMDFLFEEVREIAKKKGIEIIKDEMILKNTRDEAKFSTLQDIEAKRKTEIEMFSGVVIKLGKKLGVKTPYNNMMYDLIKALEEKNEGKLN